jgi:putative two-component system response regulator
MIDPSEHILQSKILIVDDQQPNILLLEKILELEGYTNLHSSSDPREVVPRHQEHHYDLILLDIRMPYLDGFQVMEQVDAMFHCDYLPIIVLTAQMDVETRIRALEAGAQDFLTKPFHQLEVLHRIRNYLEVRTLYNHRRKHGNLLEEKIRQRTRELEETRLEIIRRLAAAGEYRDNETGLHVVRMSKSCQVVARAAGLGEGACELILHASAMHDLGKIGIPDHILLKPGQLSSEEWDVMKNHTEIGARILGEHVSDIMQMARSIAMTHHERWDGTGYPKGLCGEEIPLEGRIAAICDVFDALTSKRPYKEALSFDEAVAIINKGAGTHFDESLVNHFNDSLPEISRIMEAYGESEM